MEYAVKGNVRSETPGKVRMPVRVKARALQEGRDTGTGSPTVPVEPRAVMELAEAGEPTRRIGLYGAQTPAGPELSLDGERMPFQPYVEYVAQAKRGARAYKWGRGFLLASLLLLVAGMETGLVAAWIATPGPNAPSVLALILLLVPAIFLFLYFALDSVLYNRTSLISPSLSTGGELSGCTVTLDADIAWEHLRYVTYASSGGLVEGEEISTAGFRRIVRVLRTYKVPPRTSEGLKAEAMSWAETHQVFSPAVHRFIAAGYDAYQVSGTCHIDGQGDYRILARLFVANNSLYQVEELYRPLDASADIFKNIAIPFEF